MEATRFEQTAEAQRMAYHALEAGRHLATYFEEEAVSEADLSFAEARHYERRYHRFL